MNLFEQLTAEDKEKIEKHIIACNYGKPLKAPLSEILQNWSRNKEFLYHFLGDKFTIERPVEFVKTIKDMESEFNKALALQSNSELNEVLTAIEEYLSKNTVVYCKGEKLGTLEDCFEFYCYNILTSSYYIIKNELSFDADKDIKEEIATKTFVLEPKGEKSFEIPKGMKTMKLFAKVAKLAKIPDVKFEKFRLFQSMITNQKKVKGTLCLSIHPLDFATMSDNASNWSSCMSWVDKGCYCQGTVEMMNSHNVMIAYIKDNKDATIRDVSWNNKKWRQLFIVDPAFTCGIKGYPYMNEEIEDACLQMIRECGDRSALASYCEKVGLIYLRGDEFDWYEMPDTKDFALYLNPCTKMMYNDFGTVKEHHCLIDFNKVEEARIHNTTQLYKLKDKSSDYEYSGESQCMCCGKPLYGYDEYENEICCNDCSGKKICEHCYTITYDGSLIKMSDHFYCKKCIAHSTYTSFYTGEIINYLEYDTDVFVDIHINNDAADCSIWSTATRTIRTNSAKEGNPEDYIEANPFGNPALFKKDTNFHSEEYTGTRFLRVNYNDLTDLGKEKYSNY